MDVQLAIKGYITNRDQFLLAGDREDDVTARTEWANATDQARRTASELGATDADFARAELADVPAEPDNPHSHQPGYSAYRALDTLLDQYAAYCGLGARARAEDRNADENRWYEAAEAGLRIADALGADADYFANAADRAERAEDFDGSAPRRACGCKHYDCTGRNEPDVLSAM